MPSVIPEGFQWRWPVLASSPVDYELKVLWRGKAVVFIGKWRMT
jgi:hypothetical protein